MQSVEVRKDYSFWVLAVTFALLGPIAAFAKMGTVPLLILSLFAHRSARSLMSRLSRARKSPIAVALAFLMVWCALSAFWSDTSHLMTLVRLLGVLVLSFLIVTMTGELRHENKERLSTILIGSITFLMVVLLIEGITDASIHRFLRPGDVAPREGEWVPYLEMVAARGTAILAPFAFVVAALLSRRLHQWWPGVCFIGTSLVATLLLPMQASALSILFGCTAFMLIRWKPRLFLNISFAGVSGLAFATPFLMTSWITLSSLESISFEPTRALTQRLSIWEYSSNLALQRPLIGHGFDTSRDIGSRGDIIEGTNWAALPLHPHNAFLQVWLELGFVGVGIVTALLWSVWQYFNNRLKSNESISLQFSSLVALVPLSLISFGVWQYWWITTWAFLMASWHLIPQAKSD